MPPRFFVPEFSEDHTFALPPAESTHAARVLRVRPGDEIRVFDGQGVEIRAEVERVAPDAVIVRPRERVTPAPEPAVMLTVLQSVIKTAAMDDVVRDAAMMGVTRLQPIVSARSNVTLEVLSRRRSVARWQRVAVAATKQCGRAVVPDIRPPMGFDAALPVAEGWAPTRILLVEPAARHPTVLSARALVDAAPPSSAVLAVGPEGGWTEVEVAAAEASGFVALALGARVLRADAVSIAAIAVLQFIWGDL